MAADNFAWAAFLGLQAAVLLRIAGALLETSPWPIWLAATLWMAVMLAWGIRHMGWYGRPRADGRPG